VLSAGREAPRTAQPADSKGPWLCGGDRIGDCGRGASPPNFLILRPGFALFSFGGGGRGALLIPSPCSPKGGPFGPDCSSCPIPGPRLRDSRTASGAEPVLMHLTQTHMAGAGLWARGMHDRYGRAGRVSCSHNAASQAGMEDHSLRQVKPLASEQDAALHGSGSASLGRRSR